VRRRRCFFFFTSGGDAWRRGKNKKKRSRKTKAGEASARYEVLSAYRLIQTVNFGSMGDFIKTLKGNLGTAGFPNLNQNSYS
jgi:hypothetical protein